jgi:hypothetical protein
VFSFKIFSLLCTLALHTHSSHASRSLLFCLANNGDSCDSKKMYFLRSKEGREREREIVVILPFMSLCGPFFVKSNKFYRKEGERKNLQTMANIFYFCSVRERGRNFVSPTIEFLRLVAAFFRKISFINSSPPKKKCSTEKIMRLWKVLLRIFCIIFSCMKVDYLL